MASHGLRSFRRWWWLVPISLVIGIGGAAIATKLAEPQYQATCRLFVAVAANTTPSETNFGAVLGQQRVATYLDLIKSDRVIDGAIASLGSEARSEGLSSTLLAKRLDVAAESQSVMISVSVTDSQSQRSADLANAVCTSFQLVAAEAELPNPVVNIKLLDKAVAPQDPISPSGTRNLQVGALIGLLVGAGFVIALERRNPVASRVPGAESTRADYSDLDALTAESSQKQTDLAGGQQSAKNLQV